MYKGKAIYQPKNKAAEYSAWACNFYVGCSNNCTYCYLKKGRGAKVLGGDKPQLKSCFEHETHALYLFSNELTKNLEELQKHGLLFSFTTDPMLPGTIELTWDAVGMAVYKEVPVKILTKCTKWVDDWLTDIKNFDGGIENPELYAFGFTLTGHDELEKGASTNAERIEAIKKLHKAGFKTWASFEPIVDVDSTWEMIVEAGPYLNMMKIGLMSGKKYDKRQLVYLIEGVNELFSDLMRTNIYWKDSLLKAAGISRESLPYNCVARDYNMFQS